MIEAVVVALLGAAAVFRIVFSATHERTIWRTTFTICIAGAAVAAALTYYGDRMDQVFETWNLSKLLLHLVLVVTAASTMIYVATLKGPAYPARAVALPIAAATGVAAVQVASWLAAPVHERPLPDFAGIPQNLSVTLFNGSFVAMLLTATLITARFCVARAFNRHDLTRTISLSLTGGACIAGSLVFALYAVVVVVSYSDPRRGAAIMAFSDALLPLVLVVLALGTLALLIAPAILQFTAAYATWRSLQPLWHDLISRHPQVHLATTLTGTPLRRLQYQVQRAIVESYDALRLIRVPLTPEAGVEELSRALLQTSRTGTCSATEVLGPTSSPIDGGAEKILELAKAYSRNRR